MGDFKIVIPATEKKKDDPTTSIADFVRGMDAGIASHPPIVPALKPQVQGSTNFQSGFEQGWNDAEGAIYTYERRKAMREGKPY